MSSVLKNRKAAILFLMPALALYTAIVLSTTESCKQATH